jgi:hypothetical protein
MQDTKQSKGGKARAKSLTPKDRSEIARKAAQYRHLKALYFGNLQKDLGVDVDCYVLNDDNRTAVISQRGVAVALGLMGGGGTAFIRFMSGKTISAYAGPELSKKVQKPLVFQSSLNGPEVEVYGYDVTILIDVCRAIIKANEDGKLTKNQQHLIRAATIITGACAKLGIQELIYKVVGLDSTKEQFLIAFRRFVQEEAKRYESEFPIELYQEWTRLYDIPMPERGWPWKFKSLTIAHVYTPLAKSNGRILKLLREQKHSHDTGTNKKLFQFLSDIGTKALRFQLGRVLEMAESSQTREEYEQKIVDRFGGQMTLPLEPNS